MKSAIMKSVLIALALLAPAGLRAQSVRRAAPVSGARSMPQLTERNTVWIDAYAALDVTESLGAGWLTGIQYGRGRFGWAGEFSAGREAAEHGIETGYGVLTGPTVRVWESRDIGLWCRSMIGKWLHGPVGDRAWHLSSRSGCGILREIDSHSAVRVMADYQIIDHHTAPNTHSPALSVGFLVRFR